MTIDKTANEEWQDELIKHKIDLLRHAAFLSLFYMKFLSDSNSVLKNTYDSDWPQRSEASRASRLRRLINEREDSWRKISDSLDRDSAALSREEAAFYAGLLSLLLPFKYEVKVPTRTVLGRIAKYSIYDSPYDDSDEKDGISGNKKATLAGMLTYLATTDIKRVKTLFLRKDGLGPKGVYRKEDLVGSIKKTKRDLISVLETGIAEIAQKVARKIEKFNPGVFGDHLFVAVLDSGTTILCRSLAGKTFNALKGPFPPLHIKCRSMRIPVIQGDDYSSLEAKSAVKSRIYDAFARKSNLDKLKSRADLPASKRPLLDKFYKEALKDYVGPAPAVTNYSDWLSKQSPSFQDDVLGVARAALFRGGKIKMENFLDTSGKTINLRNLYKRYKKEFDKAGINIFGRKNKT